MQKMLVRKDVVQQVTSKLENLKNGENKGNLGEISAISDADSKLPASKNVFNRGEFSKSFNPDTPFTYERRSFQRKGKNVERLQKVAINDLGKIPFEGKLTKYFSRNENKKMMKKFEESFESWKKNLVFDFQSENLNQIQNTVIEYSKDKFSLIQRKLEKNIVVDKVKNIDDLIKNYADEYGKKAAIFYLYNKELDRRLPGLSDSDIELMKNTLNNDVTTFPKVKFTMQKYLDLFSNEILSPVGNVIMGEHQACKLKLMNRTKLLQAIYETLKDPSIVLETKTRTCIFARQFIDNEKEKIVTSVVIYPDEKFAVISNHEKDLNELIKIGKINGLYYVKGQKKGGINKSILSDTAITSILNSHNLSIKNNFKPDYNGKNMIHKSFDIKVTDITENNKQQKIIQVQKSLDAIAKNQPFVIKHIAADDSQSYGNITLRITNFDRNKIEKAVHKMAFSLDTDIPAKGEAFNYKSQEQLTEKFVKELTEKTKAVYSFVISYFGLPEIRVVSKSDLTYKGKVVYNPETGKPIDKKDWDSFVKALENFLNRNYNGIGERIVLSSESLGRILERLSKGKTMEEVKKIPLEDLTLKHRTFDWISNSAKNMQDAFGETVSRNQAARIQVAIDSAAQRVTRVTDTMRNDIQQIIIDGVKDRQSKSQISQNLFDKCVGLNRDFQRIADTEIQNNTNNAYLKEEVYNTEEGEKVYFKRFEILDDNTCKKCKLIKNKVALWSDVPLPSEEINDPYAKYAIWEGKTDGKMPTGTMHPYCRGSWFRYYPEVDKDFSKNQ